MRIAPKPKQGQELSLDKILEENVSRKKDPAQLTIEDTTMFWRLYNVKTMAGKFNMDMYKASECGTQARSFITRARLLESECIGSPLCAFEFYAIGAFLLEGAEGTGPDQPIFQEAKEFFKAVWDRNMTLFTIIEYHEGNDTIIHLPDTPYEKIARVNIKHTAGSSKINQEAIAHHVFGCENFASLSNLWQGYHGKQPTIRPLGVVDKDLYTAGVEVGTERLSVRFELDSQQPTSTILIDRKRVGP